MIFHKVKNIFVLLFCFLFYLIRGKANKKVKRLNKVLIVQTAKLGDMVCTTPVFRAIKIRYPEVKISLLGNKLNQELLAGNNDVDDYLIKRDFFSLIKRIKHEKFDCACLISPNFINLVLVYLAKIPLIVAPKVVNGFCPYETRPYKILRSLVVTKFHYFGNYAPREYLRLLEPLNIITEDTTKRLAYSKEAEDKIINFLEKNELDCKNDFIVGIAPSVANEIKLWPVERFAKLANYLSEKHWAKIIIIGGENDRQVTNKMIEFLNKTIVFLDTCGLFNLDELKALMSKLNLFISVDSGPLYIAEAFKIPTIDIIGPMAENEQPPRGKFHKVVQVDNRKPQLHIMNARVYDKNEAKRQVNDITIEMVITKIEELLKEIKNV